MRVLVEPGARQDRARARAQPLKRRRARRAPTNQTRAARTRGRPTMRTLFSDAPHLAQGTIDVGDVPNPEADRDLVVDRGIEVQEVASPNSNSTTSSSPASVTLPRPISNMFLEGSTPKTVAPRFPCRIATSAVPVARSNALSVFYMSSTSINASRQPWCNPRDIKSLALS